MWAVYAVISAFGWASSDAFAKKAMERGVDGRLVLFFRYALSAPFLLPLLAAGIPTLSGQFWLLHLAWIPLETTALLLTIRAIRISPLSLTLPYLALTPVFLVFVSRATLGETIGVLGGVGILLVVVGSYVLHLGEARRDPLAPLRAIVREPGSRLMIAAAFLYSLTGVLGKELVRHSGSLYFSVHYTIVMAVVLAPLGLRRGAPSAPRPFPIGLVLLSALGFGLMTFFHMLALPRVEVAYLIALKRVSGVFGVLYGAFLFRERALGTRLLGCLVMVLGAVVILLRGGGPG